MMNQGDRSSRGKNGNNKSVIGGSDDFGRQKSGESNKSSMSKASKQGKAQK